MLGLCFRVYVRRSHGAGTDPAKDSMPRACRRGQGLPSDLPKHSLCLHLVVIDCKFVVRKVFGMTLPKTACPGHAIVSQMLWNTQSYLFLGKELISCKLSEWCVWLLHTSRTRKRVPLSSPGHPATKSQWMKGGEGWMPTCPKPNMCHYVLTLHLISCAEKDSLCKTVMMAWI